VTAVPLPWRLRGNARARAFVWQGLLLVLVGAIVVLVARQTTANLRLRGLASGFEFLDRTAGFQISTSALPYAPGDSYARALAVGVVNTLRVALLGIVFASVLGVGIGLALLSRIRLVAAAARAYVEVVRNTPLLLQLLFWYAWSQALPGPREPLRPLPGVYLCVRGLFMPGLAFQGGGGWLAGAALLLALLTPVVLWLSRRRRDRVGRGLPTGRLLAGGAAVLLLAALAFGHTAVTVDRPAFAGFGFRGGVSLSPEFAALLIGLSIYTAAFLGEIVRGGILAVDRGQTEAAAGLGLSRARVLRLVVLPQALRAILPPTTSQYLNLTKNSSLAVAIGYPDLMSIADTTLNQTGQAIETMVLMMGTYLALSLGISLAMAIAGAATRVGVDESRR
jgi:general L-amino acid transport system permease protein